MRNRLVLALAMALVLALTSLAFAQQLQITLVKVSSPVRPGDDATITVQTAPKASCIISVRYKSGPSRARGLGPQEADAQGRVTWTWRVGSRTTPGRWPITVTCSSGGRQGTGDAGDLVRGQVDARPDSGDLACPRAGPRSARRASDSVRESTQAPEPLLGHRRTGRGRGHDPGPQRGGTGARRADSRPVRPALLAYVWQDRTLFNMLILKEGYAQVLTIRRTSGTRTSSSPASAKRGIQSAGFGQILVDGQG
jgi:hypothetical protein